MPAYVPNYRHDIFVSYAHVDDLTYPDIEKGWVTTLIAGLKVGLSQKLGRGDIFSLWKDEQLAHNKPFSPEILQALTQSATLIIILSPGYKASNWCLKEMDSFWQSLTERANSRIFVVERDKLEIDEKPKVLEELLGYRFWVQDREGKSPRILGNPVPDPRERLYYDMLGDLVQDLAKELNQLKLLAGKPAELQAQPQPDERPAVFLAEVTDDLETKRDQIKRHLDQEGYRVIPAETSHFISYLGGNDKVAETIAKDLKNCKLFLQILSGLTGKCRPGQLSFPALQYQAAVAQNIPILQWRDPDLKLETIESTDHRALLQGDTVLAIGLEAFKQECITQLNSQTQKPKTIDNPNMVFLNASPEDFALAEAIGEVLEQHNIDYALPSREDDPKLIQEDLKLWLSECDALIIIYGPMSYTWARAQMLYNRRIIGERKRPLKALAIYEGPPENKKPLGVGLPGMLTLNCRQGLQESHLLPFITALQRN